MDWILTASGKRFDLLDPKKEQICFTDIMHSLSLQCRFTGHTKKRYSIAQHSCIVANICVGWKFSDIKKNADLYKQALFHDATEAYIGDISTPLKRCLPDIKAIEHRVWQVICEKFGIDPVVDDRVKNADIVALMTERRDLMPKSPEPWGEKYESVAPGQFVIRAASVKESRTMFFGAARSCGISHWN